MGRGNIYLGKAGEEKAVVFLRKRGYRIVGRNFRTPFGELDIIARHGRSLVFVEVKSRLSSSLGPPFLSVTPAKQRRLVRNALFYIKESGLADQCWRIDVVSVKLNYAYEVESIELIENAVEDL